MPLNNETQDHLLSVVATTQTVCTRFARLGKQKRVLAQGNRVKAFAPVSQPFAPVSQAFAPVSQALAPVSQALAPVSGFRPRVTGFRPVPQPFAPVSWPDLVRPPTTFCVDPSKVLGNRASEHASESSPTHDTRGKGLPLRRSPDSPAFWPTLPGGTSRPMARPDRCPGIVRQGGFCSTAAISDANAGGGKTR
jgi:hypothetical protein